MDRLAAPPAGEPIHGSQVSRRPEPTNPTCVPVKRAELEETLDKTFVEVSTFPSAFGAAILPGSRGCRPAVRT